MISLLTPDEIERFLKGEVVGRIGCHARGTTYVVPTTYVYDGAAVIGRSADGLKIQMMRENPIVCFEVDRVDDLANWRSVIAWGRFEELRGAEADQAVAAFMSRLFPLVGTNEASQPPKSLTHQFRTDTVGTVVFRIVLGERSGRFEHR